MFIIIRLLAIILIAIPLTLNIYIFLYEARWHIPLRILFPLLICFMLIPKNKIYRLLLIFLTMFGIAWYVYDINNLLSSIISGFYFAENLGFYLKIFLEIDIQKLLHEIPIFVYCSLFISLFTPSAKKFYSKTEKDFYSNILDAP